MIYMAKSEVTADASCRLSKLAGEELSSLQASNFSSTGDISAHASGVRTLVLRVLKAAISLTKAKPSKQKDQVRTSWPGDVRYSPRLPASHIAIDVHNKLCGSPVVIWTSCQSCIRVCTLLNV